MINTCKKKQVSRPLNTKRSQKPARCLDLNTIHKPPLPRQSYLFPNLHTTLLSLQTTLSLPLLHPLHQPPKTLAPHLLLPLPDIQSVPLFFERFPIWVEFQDLRKVFLKLGQVTKLFVCKRKISYGRRFGFVDILSPLSVSDIYDQANKIWFHIYKMRVNPAKSPFQTFFPTPKPISKLVTSHNFSC